MDDRSLIFGVVYEAHRDRLWILCHFYDLLHHLLYGNNDEFVDVLCKEVQHGDQDNTDKDGISD
jgi:hypothetical protein